MKYKEFFAQLQLGLPNSDEIFWVVDYRMDGLRKNTIRALKPTPAIFGVCPPKPVPHRPWVMADGKNTWEPYYFRPVSERTGKVLTKCIPIYGQGEHDGLHIFTTQKECYAYYREQQLTIQGNAQKEMDEWKKRLDEVLEFSGKEIDLAESIINEGK